MRVLILAAILAAGPAFAGDLVARRGDDSIRLTDKPCPPEVLKHVEQGSRGYFRAARAFIDCKIYEACWAEAGGTAFIQYPDGDRGMIPMAAFSDPMT